MRLTIPLLLCCLLSAACTDVTYRGRVLLPDGPPAAGVHVNVSRTWDAIARTDASGRFELSHPKLVDPFGDLAVIAFADGYGSVGGFFDPERITDR